MSQSVNLFGIDIAAFTAKEAMKAAIAYLEGETINTIEVVTLGTLMKEKDDEQWKEYVQKFDLLLAGDQALLETSEEYSQTLRKDLENKTFLRMFFKYLKKNKKRLFLLAETEDDVLKLHELLKGYESGLIIAGAAILPVDSKWEERVINEINGIEPDCIISALPSPRDERFVVGSKALLNARLWMHGVTAVPRDPEIKLSGRMREFVTKKIFRYQVEKEKQ